MTIKVLVVDDSSFFRRRISEIINADVGLEVLDVAVNGKEAIAKAKELKPDVITMDIEMPILDGISAVSEIMATNPIPILMLSTLTREGADATLRSLEAGAVDYFPKRFEEISSSHKKAVDLLLERIKTVATSHVHVIPNKTATATPLPKRVPLAIRKAAKKYDMILIGTSTGGPPALQEVLGVLPEDFPVPIVIVQHMPSAFTGAFARRVDMIAAVSVKEAETGDTLLPGKVFIAPGGKQLLIEKKVGKAVIKITESEETQNYKPCIDVTLHSMVEHFASNTLVIILTGMGADGCQGAIELKKKGATVWAQDEESSVVYGMPQAVVNAGITDGVLPLKDIGPKLAKEV